MKIYIVKYSASGDVDVNDPVFFDNIQGCYYAGTDYKKALAQYKRCVKWQSESTKFISIDIDKFEYCNKYAGVQTEANLVRLASEYKRYIQCVANMRSQLTKDGKLTIILDKECFDCKAKHDKGERDGKWSRFDIDKSVNIEVLKELTEIWVREHNITFPFKVNCEGKTLVKYN